MRPCTNNKLANDGSYPDLQPAARANLSSTVDYHRSLLDQHRQQHESTRSSGIHTQQCHPRPNHSRGSLRQWLPLSNARKTGPATYNNNKDTTRKCNKTKNEKDHSSLESQPQSQSPSPPYPHLTRKDLEEFEALPVAIRRKVSCDIFFPFFFLSFFFVSSIPPCLHCICKSTKRKKNRLVSLLQFSSRTQFSIVDPISFVFGLTGH